MRFVQSAMSVQSLIIIILAINRLKRIEMGNTLENKAKFFALYWGQLILMQADGLGVKKCIQAYWEKSISSRYLELKPLSSISDEDAEEIARLYYERCGINFKKSDLIKYEIHTSVRESDLNAVCLDFIYNHSWGKEKSTLFLRDTKQTDNRIVDTLRDMGYAFSWSGLSVKDLIEYGWIKLKSE